MYHNFLDVSTGPPPPAYGAQPPQQGYGAPPPQQGYGAPPPQQGYAQPYAQPAPGFGPPGSYLFVYNSKHFVAVFYYGTVIIRL